MRPKGWRPSKEIANAARKWDATTAYGCAVRGEVFDATRERQYWEVFRTLLAVEWPEAWETTTPNGIVGVTGIGTSGTIILKEVSE